MHCVSSTTKNLHNTTLFTSKISSYDIKRQSTNKKPVSIISTKDSLKELVEKDNEFKGATS